MDLEQIFEYAIDQEIKAHEFYETSAARTENAEAASLFRSLARMEIGHRRALENEYRALREAGAIPGPKPPPSPEEEELLVAYRRAAEVLREANVALQRRQTRIEAELQMAGQIQTRLLPRKVPQLPGLEASVGCYMAEEVGGDFYDFLFNPLGEFCLTIGDVSGKGVPAALLSVAVRVLWRSKVRDGHPPEELLNLLNLDLSAEFRETDQFVTVLSTGYDPANGVLAFANAGHWPPLYLPWDEDEFLPFPPGFLPIGVDGDAYRRHELRTSPGDVIVLFTDGLIDARGAEGRFGERRLREVIRDNRKESAEGIRDAIVGAVTSFSPGEPSDDQTLVVLRRV